MPGAPSWLGLLAATTRAQGGSRQGARQMLLGLRDSPDGYIRRAAERTLEQLTALDEIDAWQARVEQFNLAHGRYPSGWSEMIREKTIPGIPVDPHGTPFFYDAVTGRVTLSPESPLSPLPEMLKPR